MEILITEAEWRTIKVGDILYDNACHSVVTVVEVMLADLSLFISHNLNGHREFENFPSEWLVKLPIDPQGGTLETIKWDRKDVNLPPVTDEAEIWPTSYEAYQAEQWLKSIRKAVPTKSYLSTLHGNRIPI